MYHLHGCINTSLCLSLRHTLTCELNIQHNATICQSLLLVGSKTVTTQDHFLSMTTPCHEYQKFQEDGQRPTDIMSCILFFWSRCTSSRPVFTCLKFTPLSQSESFEYCKDQHLSVKLHQLCKWAKRHRTAKTPEFCYHYCRRDATHPISLPIYVVLIEPPILIENQVL